MKDRSRGALIGLAVGDALGAAVEFKPPGSFAPVTGYRSGGPHGLDAGEWTDDTSMALALADSIGAVGSEGGSVPDLLVENSGDIRVLFLEGEELVGAKAESHSQHVRPPPCQKQDQDSGQLRGAGPLGVQIQAFRFRR